MKTVLGLALFCLGLNVSAAETSYKVSFDIQQAGKTISKPSVVTKVNEPITLTQEKDNNSITVIVTPTETELKVKASVVSKNNSKDEVIVNKTFAAQNNSTETFTVKNAQGIEYTFKMVAEKNKVTK